MEAWYSPLVGVGPLKPVEPDSVSNWPDRAFSQSLNQLSICPLIFSEAMVLSHRLPLSARNGPKGYELFAQVGARQCFSEANEWRGGYKPLALRLLPFHAESDGQVFQIGMDKEIASPEQPETARQLVAQMLKAYGAGRKKASILVEQIFAEGLIAEPDEIGAPLLPGPGISSFSDIVFSASSAESFTLFVTIAFSQRNHRRRAPLFELVRGQSRYAAHKPDTSIENFASFLDFGSALAFDEEK